MKGVSSQYLDFMGSLNPVRAYKRSMLELLEIEQGGRYLDFGCGSGDDAREISNFVSGGCLVIGIDNDPLMIDEANRRNDPSDTSVIFGLMDAHHTIYTDNSFNGCRADRTLQHVYDPKEVFLEIVRVTIPDGKIVVHEPDWRTLIIRSPERTISSRGITEAVTSHIFDFLIPHGCMGRELPGLFKESGMDPIVVPQVGTFTDFKTASRVFRLEEAVTNYSEVYGGIFATDAKKWLRDLSKMEHFFASITSFVVAGKKL